MKLILMLSALVALSNWTRADVSHLIETDRHYLPPDPKKDDAPAVYQKVKHISEKVTVHAKNHNDDHYEKRIHDDEPLKHYHHNHDEPRNHQDEYVSNQHKQEHKSNSNVHQLYDQRAHIDPYILSTPNALVSGTTASNGQVRNFFGDYLKGGLGGNLFNPINSFEEREGAASERQILATAPNSVFHTQINVQSQDSRFNVPNTLPQNRPRAGVASDFEFPPSFPNVSDFPRSTQIRAPNGIETLPDGRRIVNDFIPRSASSFARNVPSTNNNNVDVARSANLREPSDFRTQPNSRRVLDSQPRNVPNSIEARNRNSPVLNNDNNVPVLPITQGGIDIQQRRQLEAALDPVQQMTFADTFGTNSRPQSRAQILPSTAPRESTSNIQRINLINGNLIGGVPSSLGRQLPDQATRNIQGANIINGNILGRSLGALPAADDASFSGRSFNEHQRTEHAYHYEDHIPSKNYGRTHHHNERIDHHDERTDHHNERIDHHNERTDHHNERTDHHNERTDHHNERSNYHDHHNYKHEQRSGLDVHHTDHHEQRSHQHENQRSHHDHNAHHTNHKHSNDHEYELSDHHKARSHKQEHKGHDDRHTDYHNQRDDHYDGRTLQHDERHHLRKHTGDKHDYRKDHDGYYIDHNDERKEHHDHSANHHDRGHTQKSQHYDSDENEFDPEASAPEVIFAPGNIKQGSTNSFKESNLGLKTAASSFDAQYRNDGYHYGKPKKFFEF